jgi:hypothetical protein
MAVKKKNKKIKLQRNKSHIILVILSILILVLFVAVFILHKDLMKVEENAGKNDITYFVSEAVNNLTREAPVVSYTNIQFINEMKIQFENINSASVAYSYGPADLENGEDQLLVATSVQLKNRSDILLKSQLSIDDVFNAVPGVQQCSRPFLLSYNKNGSKFYENYSIVHEKLLNNGQTIYISKTNEPLCQGSEELVSELLETLKTVQNY